MVFVVINFSLSRVLVSSYDFFSHISRCFKIYLWYILELLTIKMWYLISMYSRVFQIILYCWFLTYFHCGQKIYFEIFQSFLIPLGLLYILACVCVCVCVCVCFLKSIRRHLKRTCILLLLGGIFYMYLLDLFVF